MALTQTSAADLASELLEVARNEGIHLLGEAIFNASAGGYDLCVNDGKVHRRTSLQEYKLHKDAYEAVVPDHQFIVYYAIGQGNHIAMLFRHRCTVNDQRIDFPVVFLLTLDEEGRIIRNEEHFDSALAQPFVDAMTPVLAPKSS